MVRYASSVAARADDSNGAAEDLDRSIESITPEPRPLRSQFACRKTRVEPESPGVGCLQRHRKDSGVFECVARRRRESTPACVFGGVPQQRTGRHLCETSRQLDAGCVGKKSECVALSTNVSALSSQLMSQLGLPAACQGYHPLPEGATVTSPSVTGHYPQGHSKGRVVRR